MLEENKMKEAKRRGGKRAFNLFDLVVIALVLCGIALLVSGVLPIDFSGGDGGTEKAGVTFTVVIGNVSESDLSAIRTGDEVFDDDGVTSLGTVTDITAAAHLEPVMVGGTCEMREIPGRVDLVVTVVSESATYREGAGYLLGTVPVRVGAGMTLRFPGYYGIGICDAVSAQPVGRN